MTLHHGDCLDVMAAMEPESVDAVVTDPPYGLEFMGKEWDRLGDRGKIKHTGPEDRDASTVFGRQRVSFYGSANRKCRACGHWEWSGTPCKCERPDFETHQAPQARLMQEWHARWAEAAYRVAKPSAYLLAFGGTRTVHRMTVALEDAGWIIRDMLVWGYASGFPKSKASLKPAWEPIVMARKPGPLRMLAIDENPVGEDGDRWPANVVTLDDSLGDFARFVAIPKADRSDREPVLGGSKSGPRVNGHPTVKSLDLMRHLVRLVTPAGGTVLDPFLGSGTTALAAEMEGFAWIGIEREAEYVAIAEARLNGTQRGMGLGA